MPAIGYRATWVILAAALVSAHLPFFLSRHIGSLHHRRIALHLRIISRACFLYHGN